MTIRKNFREKINFLGIIFLSVLILIYFIFRIFNFIYGPIVTIKSPINGEIIKNKTFYIEGTAKNVKNISINGKDISIDQNGNFKEEIIAKSPYTLIIIDSIDKYNKTKEKILEVGKE